MSKPNFVMRHNNGKLLETAIEKKIIVTARTTIPKELKPIDGVYPEVEVTLFITKTGGNNDIWIKT